MKKASTLHEIINKTSLFPAPNPSLFDNLNLYADLFYSSRTKNLLSLLRAPRPKPSKKANPSSVRHQTHKWYFTIELRCSSKSFPLGFASPYSTLNHNVGSANSQQHKGRPPQPSKIQSFCVTSRNACPIVPQPPNSTSKVESR